MLLAVSHQKRVLGYPHELRGLMVFDWLIREARWVVGRDRGLQATAHRGKRKA